MLSNQFDTKSNSTPFHMVCKEVQYDVVELIFNGFGIKLNALNVKGMTLFKNEL